jgi:hypothetical protein
MKKQISRALLGIAATLALTVAAYAQTARAVVVQIPFDFVAGQKELPAGRYRVSRVRSEAEITILIRSEDGRASAVVLTNTGEGNPRAAALTFRRHGDRYFLAAISMPGISSVRELPKSGGERRVERELVEQTRSKEGSGESKTITVAGRMQ